MTNGEFYAHDEDRLADAANCQGIDCEKCRIWRRGDFVRGIPGLSNKACWERFAALEYGVPLDIRIPVVIEQDPNPL